MVVVKHTEDDEAPTPIGGKGLDVQFCIFCKAIRVRNTSREQNILMFFILQNMRKILALLERKCSQESKLHANPRLFIFKLINVCS